MEVFNLVGKISIEYSDAVKNIKKVSESAEDAGKEVEETGEKAEKAGEQVEGSGNSARSANEGFSIWKATLANLASEAITALIQKCAELAGQVVDLTKSAVSNYAEYEQLVGGVETLFKDSSSTLIGYAENAYNTAGMSSNQYMETATSFAASLIQGLGSDTAKAVELTNLAITDMSDNANKMGTDIESIQNAYQGFAKQNYTMLDNLKLGYGGTQSEMVRLINDSGILNEKIENLDNVTFDQMIQAIHKIQDNLGITGTTADEAGTTIQGSWGSVQALFENILTKVGSELAPVVMNFLNQLSAWMQSVDWDAFAESIGNSLSQLLTWLSQIDFTTVFSTGLTWIQSFISWLGQLIDKMPEVISWLQQLGLGEMFDAGKEGLRTFIEKIAELIPQVLDAITHIQNIKQTISDLAPIIVPVVTAIGTLLAALQITSIINSVKTAFTSLFAVLSANPISLIVAAIAGLVAGIMYLWNTNEDFRNTVIAAWEAIKTAFNTVVEAIKGFFTGLVESLKTAWDNIKNTVSNTMNTIKTTISNIWNAIKTTISNVINGIKTTISNVFNAIKTTISNILNGIKTTFSNIWNGIKTAVSNVINGIKSVISGGLTGAKDTVSNTLGKIKEKFSSIFNGAKDIVKGAIEKIKGFFNFKWSLPSLKMPHFSISGSFSLNPLSVPHFSIDWYKKAMEDGMILDQPTIFGFNPNNNSFLAGGESGSETVVGTNNLMTMIQTAVDNANGGMTERLNVLVNLIEKYFPDMLASMRKAVVLDSGTLVGELAPDIDEELGRLYLRGGR